MVTSRASKRAREHKVLLGLVELYIETGIPVGSNTLKESGFRHLSSATLRNYFANLEEQGYLTQQHASGGRIPTDLAYRMYADEHRDHVGVSFTDEELLQVLAREETPEITAYLEKAAEQLSSITHAPVFLCAPRFDHDFIQHLKLVGLDSQRCLCILVTDFGVIKTEVLRTPKSLSNFSLKRIEGYFYWRLTGHDKPEELTEEEEFLAQEFYNEMIVRYIVGYSNFSDEEIFRTGFSQLLTYPDFNDVAALANSLALFENPHSMRLLLRECSKANALKFWIGDDLASYSTVHPNCSVIAVPYHISHKAVGAFGVLGPLRMPYRQLFGILRRFSEIISEALTKSVYKFEITYRQPQRQSYRLEKSERILLEDKSQ